MGKYKKRTDGRYQATIQVGFDPNTGKAIRKNLCTKSQAELDRQVAMLRTDVIKGTYADDEGMNLEKWTNEWFDVEIACCGVRTKQMYKRCIGIIIDNIGSIRLKDLRKSDIQKLLNIYADRVRTCQQLKMTINRILESAIDEGLIYKNVCRKITIPKYITKEKRALTDIEKKAIEKTVLSDKERAFVSILFYTGIRRGEILALSRNDIDMKGSTITIKNVITFEENTPILKDIPKSQAGKRTLPIPQKLKTVLKKYLNSCTTQYLFLQERNNIFMSVSSYNKFWNGITRKLNAYAGGTADIKVIYSLSAHVFRHNYATMLYYAGVDIKEAQYLLGHSDIKMTLGVYTHLENKNNGSAADKITAYLQGKQA